MLSSSERPERAHAITPCKSSFMNILHRNACSSLWSHKGWHQHMVNTHRSTLEELLDSIVLCENCINFKSADLGGKECAVVKEKKILSVWLPFFLL